MSRKEALSSFIQQIHGRPIVVKLNNGVDYRGVLTCLDGYMNIALEQTEEYSNGQLRNKFGDTFIRGNNVLYIIDGKQLADNNKSLTATLPSADINNCNEKQQTSGQKVNKFRSISVATPFLRRYSSANYCRTRTICDRSLMSGTSLTSTSSRPMSAASSYVRQLTVKSPLEPSQSVSTSLTSLAYHSTTVNLAHRTKHLLKSFLNNRLRSSSDHLKSSLTTSCTTLKIIELAAASEKHSLITASSPNIHQSLKPWNRLRVPSANSMLTTDSRLCLKCSSLLSMLSSSKYSLCVNGNGFIPVPRTYPDKNTFLCKLCLTEVDYHDVYTIQQCSCHFCHDCMKTYVQYEIAEGAYDIACPDAQCPREGVLTIIDIENLVLPDIVHKHQKYRLNREIDIDKTRTWCPRVGCETVCTLCTSEQCQPQSVHCSTCTTNFCSNCKNDWHPDLTCEENKRKLVKEGKKTEDISISFDSDLIKCCPMCNVPIEKDEGCAQMMCKRCKHVFCWYCLASLDDDFLLTHYDRGPCKNKLGHSRASVIWHRAQVIGIFAGFGILLLIASPLLLLVAPCIVCCKCRVCNNVENKLDHDHDHEIHDEVAL